MLPQVRTSRLRNHSFITTSQGLRELAPTHTALGDLFCVFLGCHMPMMVRPAELGHGFRIMDGEAILGVLPREPRSQTVEFYRDDIRVSVQHFRNTETGQLTTDDPRLGHLPDGWERIKQDRIVDDPRWFSRFVNKSSNASMNSDPRVRERRLKERGITFQNFNIV
ncbi:hypothetical protein F5Y03DRAFT_405727 [Xylaria venustula]|nr:hypothetical protein F5Y03DRAFT_405727 [Xylaria venustula]